MLSSIVLLTGYTGQEKQSSNYETLNESIPTLNSDNSNPTTVTYIYGNSELLAKAISNGTKSEIVYLIR